MSNQETLFPKPKKARVLRMRMIDAGPNCGGKTEHIALYRCPRCKTESEWLEARTITEIRRGIPCEKCNAKP